MAGGDESWRRGWEALQFDPEWIAGNERWKANPSLETNHQTLIDLKRLKARYGVYETSKLDRPEKLQWYLASHRPSRPDRRRHRGRRCALIGGVELRLLGAWVRPIPYKGP